jgi:hypothetical protein
MRILQEKKIEADSITGLDRYIQIYRVDIDGSINTITIYYQINLLSPTKIIMKTESENSFTRFDRLETYKDIAIEVTPSVYDENNTLVTAATFEIKTVVDRPANLKFTQLETSAVGQGIKQILRLDLDLYPNFQQK